MSAALVTALAGAWVCLTVRYNYQGNWSALFMTGGNIGAPGGPDFRNTYVFAGSYGYDGQFYRIMAHDPGLRRGLFIDSPRLRYRRILVPALAYALALGNPWRIDGAYIAVVLGFLFLGSYWMARWAVRHERSPAWGLAFAALPATLVSLDRMTTDAALAALCCAWAVYAADRAAGWPSTAVLVFLPFARETGLLLSAASALREASARQFWRAALVLATAIPYLAWCGFAAARTPPEITNWLHYPPLAGIAAAFLNGPGEPPRLPLRAIVVALHYAALCGIVLGIGLCVVLWWRNRGDRLAIAALLFALLAVQIGNADIWAHVFGFGRIFSPLLLLLSMHAIGARRPIFLMPLMLTVPRAVCQFAPQALGIIRGVFG